jgi:hypothetical protein
VIRDLLWGCVVCGAMESIREIDRVETCNQCGAKYRRSRGAQIAVEVADKGIETRSAAEWTAQLPAVTPTGKAECLARFAESDIRVSGYGVYLGRVERFGDFRFGHIELTEQALVFTARDGEGSFEWPLGDLTAVQPSSTALQVKAKGRPVVAFKFVDSSSRMWEERLQLALRQHYSTREVIEFQPRICLR